MTEYVHSFRRNFFSSDRTYRLAPDGLECNDNRGTRLIRYCEFEEEQMCISKVHGALAATMPRRFDYVLRCRDGSKIIMQPVHHVRLLGAEDRSSTCYPLIIELRERIARANPNAKFKRRLSWSYKLDAAMHRVINSLGVMLWRLARRSDLDRMANFMAWAARKIGPRLRGHRIASANLAAAYPDKSAAEIEQILAGMWDNIGRLVIDYINLDRLFERAIQEPGRLVVAPGMLENLVRARDSGQPSVIINAHIAAYEIGAAWAKYQGLELAILYNRPKFGPLSDPIMEMRSKCMGHLIEGGSNATRKIAAALKDGMHLALFPDQYLRAGIEVTFFGRPCKVNPLAARFARLFDCPVYGFWTVRLPGNRIRLESEELQMPRDAEGKIDVEGAMQAITSSIEGWVRAHPEQWLWLQRRWR